VQVTGGDPATDFGAGRTYELAIFKDELAPVLAEELPPAIDSIVPNFGADLIDVTASDDAVGDSGLCGVSLGARLGQSDDSVSEPDARRSDRDL
jgi:hypothetical protein